MPDSQTLINLPREDSVILLVNCYLDLNFEVIKEGDDSGYANGDDIRLIYQWLLALLSNCNLTTSSGKHLEGISHAHFVFI